jgi:hypothetical protein
MRRGSTRDRDGAGVEFRRPEAGHQAGRESARAHGAYGESNPRPGTDGAAPFEQCAQLERARIDALDATRRDGDAATGIARVQYRAAWGAALHLRLYSSDPTRRLHTPAIAKRLPRAASFQENGIVRASR